MNRSEYSLYVGIDISAEKADAVWAEAVGQIKGAYTLSQTRTGHKALIERLRQTGHAAANVLVVMEATSTYWMMLALFLHEAGFGVSVINPARSRHFARMQLQSTKTDALDARLLVDFARMVQPTLWTPPPPICHQLHQRLSQRQDLLAIKGQEQNRLHALRHNPLADPSLLQRLHRHLRFLAGEIKTLDNELKALLRGDHEWADAARRLLTITGIGYITAAWILVATHNFAFCDNPEQAAAFAGLAPHARDSGSSVRGKRSVGKGGHAALRQTLYMAAASAARYNPPIQTFYDRLVRRGKLKKVARCAAARKLLHIAWAVVVKQRDFDPNYGQTAALTRLAA